MNKKVRTPLYPVPQGRVLGYSGKTDRFDKSQSLYIHSSTRKGLVPLNRLSQRKNFDIAPTRKRPLQNRPYNISFSKQQEKSSHRRERRGSEYVS